VTAGERVRAWRKIRGWSLRELARRSEINVSTIWRIENAVQEARADELKTLSDCFGITLPEFFGDIGPQRKAAQG